MKERLIETVSTIKWYSFLPVLAVVFLAINIYLAFDKGPKYPRIGG